MKHKSKPQWYHLLPVRLDVIIKTWNNKCWGRCSEKGTLCAVGGIADWWNYYVKPYGGFSNNWKYNYHMIQQSSSYIYIQRKTKSQRTICTPMFIASLFTLVKVWEKPKYSSAVEVIKTWYVCIHTHTQWRLIHPWERRISCHLWQHGWGPYYAKWNKSHKERYCASLINRI